jgi:hypothetical protein
LAIFLSIIIWANPPHSLLGDKQGEQGLDMAFDFPFFPGETISYDIMKLRLKAGEATLVYNGPVKINNRDAVLITFTSKALKFLDEEEIFLDPTTFYPITVKRNLNLWGKKECIVEEYSSDKGLVKITKESNGKVTEQVIENPFPLDNIYGFIYRYRKSGQFRIGEILKIHLPTRDVEFRLVEMRNLKTDDKTLDAYYMESSPKKYKVWFGQDHKRIPLRIDGAVGIGNTSMVINSYRGSL